MAEPTYAELLRHPKWQEKRLRVMERDGFKCAECGDRETTLNVHHGYYTKGAKPWEYPDESLKCLCEPCHARRHEKLTEIKALAGCLAWVFLDLVLGMLKAITLAEASSESDAGRFLTIEMGHSAHMQLTGVCLVHSDIQALVEAIQPAVDASGRLTGDAIRAALDRMDCPTQSAPAAEPLESSRAPGGDCRM